MRCSENLVTGVTGGLFPPGQAGYAAGYAAGYDGSHVTGYAVTPGYFGPRNRPDPSPLEGTTLPGYVVTPTPCPAGMEEL